MRRREHCAKLALQTFVLRFVPYPDNNKLFVSLNFAKIAKQDNLGQAQGKKTGRGRFVVVLFRNGGLTRVFTKRLRIDTRLWLRPLPLLTTLFQELSLYLYLLNPDERAEKSRTIRYCYSLFNGTIENLETSCGCCLSLSRQ